MNYQTLNVPNPVLFILNVHLTKNKYLIAIQQKREEREDLQTNKIFCGTKLTDILPVFINIIRIIKIRKQRLLLREGQIDRQNKLP